MSSAVILNAGQHDPHLLATKDVKGGNLMADPWIPIPNLQDPHVQENAKFAVAEHNTEKKDDLIYMRVLSGETKSVIGGMYYHLNIEAQSASLFPPQKGFYEAIVWEAQTNPISRKLVLFVPVAN